MAIIYLDRPVQAGDPAGSVYDPTRTQTANSEIMNGLMEEDAIINPYESFIVDPETVSPNIDVTGLRTQAETETNPFLLANVPDPEIQGLDYDPTNYGAYSDLFNFYTSGLPTISTPATDTAQIPGAADILVDTGSQDQATGDLMQDSIQQPDTTVSNIFEGSPFIETSPNVLSAVNAAGEPIPGNIVDPTTGNIFAPGDYSDVAGTTSDPREVIDVAAPASQFVDQGFMEDDYGIYDPDIPTSSILDQTFTSTPANTGIPEIGLDSEFIVPAGGITQPTLNPAGTGDASIAEQIATADRGIANIPAIDPIVDPGQIIGTPTPTIQQPIDFSVIDSQTADELGAQFTPMQVEEAQKPENVDLYNKVIDGTKTAASFIADKGATLYNIYQIAQGGFTSAIGGLNLLGLNPATGFLGLVGSGFKDTPSQQEYESYSDEQQAEIDKQYGPGGVMEGYNAVSGFGRGIKATVQSRLDERRSNGIPDTSATSQELIGLQNNLGITDFTQLTQEEIQDMDDVDPADYGLVDAATADIQDFADIMPDELPDTPTSGPNFGGGVTTNTIFDAEDEEDYSTPAPAPAPAPAPSYYDFGDSDSDSDSGGGGGSPGSSGPGGSDEMGSFKKGGFVKKYGKR